MSLATNLLFGIYALCLCLVVSQTGVFRDYTYKEPIQNINHDNNNNVHVYHHNNYFPYYWYNSYSPFGGYHYAYEEPAPQYGPERQPGSYHETTHANNGRGSNDDDDDKFDGYTLVALGVAGLILMGAAYIGYQCLFIFSSMLAIGLLCVNVYVGFLIYTYYKELKAKSNAQENKHNMALLVELKRDRKIMIVLLGVAAVTTVSGFLAIFNSILMVYVGASTFVLIQLLNVK